MNLIDVLKKLDPNNEKQWTVEGLPKVDVVSDLMGSAVTRQMITEVAPDLTQQSISEIGGGDALTTNEPSTTTEKTTANEPKPNVSADANGEQNEPPASEEQPEQVDPIQALRNERHELHVESIEMQAAMNKLQEAITWNQNRMQYIDRLLPNPNSPAENMNTIQRYLATSTAARAEKVKNHQALVSQGVDLSMMAIKAPLDAAMSQRKGNRANQRPSIQIPASVKR